MSRVFCGDCRELMAAIPDNSIDAMVCDPPAGIEFMGKHWDTFKEGKRSKGWACANKSGGDGFGGFGKVLRPAFHTQRADRDNFIAFMVEVFTDVMRVLKPGAHCLVWAIPRTSHWTAMALEDAGMEVRDCISHVFGQGFPKSKDLGGGVGTALKPAHEQWILARTPLAESSITKNYETWRTGGINIDACRVEGRDRTEYGLATAQRSQGSTYGVPSTSADFDSSKGRWPPNLLLSDDAIDEMDRQSGASKSQKGKPRRSQEPGEGYGMVHTGAEYDDQGGASRFFPCFRYQAKPSRAEKEAGLDDLPTSTLNRVNPGGLENEPRFAPVQVKNNHPTVKSIDLCRWLCRLITPPGGIILDPFAGSGSIGCAAVLEGFRFIGFEQDPHYVEIANRRLSHWEKQI